MIENGDLEVVITNDLVADHSDYVARLHEALPGLADRPIPASSTSRPRPRCGRVVLLGDASRTGC